MIFCQLTKNYILFFTQYSQYFSGFCYHMLTHNHIYQIVYNNVDKYGQISIHLLKKAHPLSQEYMNSVIHGIWLGFLL